MVSVYCLVTKACARRPGAAASVERRRREHRTLLAGAAGELAGATRLRQARPSSACTFSAKRTLNKIKGCTQLSGVHFDISVTHRTSPIHVEPWINAADMKRVKAGQNTQSIADFEGISTDYTQVLAIATVATERRQREGSHSVLISAAGRALIANNSPAQPKHAA